jgi:hypothetical protein
LDCPKPDANSSSISRGRLNFHPALDLGDAGGEIAQAPSAAGGLVRIETDAIVGHRQQRRAIGLSLEGHLDAMRTGVPEGVAQQFAQDLEQMQLAVGADMAGDGILNGDIDGHRLERLH